MWNPFSTRRHKETAARLVADLVQKLPPAKKGRKPISDAAIENSLKTLYQAVAGYAAEQGLGVLGRARFAKALQDQLAGAGYPAELVTKITSAVTMNALVHRPLDR